MALLPRLMLVTDRRRIGEDRSAEAIEAALTAGPAMVQIREKDLSDQALEAMVLKVRSRAGGRGVIVVNDRPEVARATASGLHLPAAAVAAATGSGTIRPLGCSIHDRAETEAALALRPDYLVAGTVLPTGSKPGAEPCGMEGLERLVALSGGLPVFAIGGLHASVVPAALAAGAWGVAVCAAVLGAEDPGREAALLLRQLGQGSTLEG